jgi:hypothetical protein
VFHFEEHAFETRDLEPIASFVAIIQRASSRFMEMLAQRKAEEGLWSQGAALLRPCLALLVL